MKRRRLKTLLALYVFSFGPGFSGAAVADEALADTLAGYASRGGTPNGFGLIAECRSDGEARAVEIRADGTATWGGRAQFGLSTSDVREILALLERHDFAHMPEIFGGAVQPESEDDRPTVIRDDEPSARAAQRDSAEEIPAAVIIVCRVALSLDGMEKHVMQRARGVQSVEFKEMATAILDVCESPAGNGVTADNLGDGLEKLASKKLTASLLTLLVHRKVAEPSAAAGYGWLLRIEDGRALARTYDAQGALSVPTALDLDDKKLTRILDLLSRNAVDTLPINIQARDYTEVVVEILNQRRGIQARRFAADAGHPENVEAFENIVAGLEVVYREVVEEGA